MPLPFGRGQLTPAMHPLGLIPIFHDCTSGTLRHPSRSSLAEAGGNRLLSPCTDRSFAFLGASRIRTDFPLLIRQMLYQLSYRYCSNDARGQAFRILLDTKCAAPSCPSPTVGTRRPIRTASSGFEPEAETRMAGSKLSRRLGRTTIPTLRLSPLSLSREPCEERSSHGPQHSPSVLSSGLQDQPPT